MDGLRVFGGPLRYVQGPGALDSLGDVVGARHRACAVLIDEFLIESLRPRVVTLLTAAGVTATVLPIGGEVTQARIEVAAEVARPGRPTGALANGGGMTLGTGKGVARTLGLRIVAVPTIASNDGP